MPAISKCSNIFHVFLTWSVFAGLTPNTTYRVSIRAKNIKASPYVDEKSLIRLLEKLSAHTEFRTLKKGLPDPPMDVRVDPGPQDGTVLVTWIPVTLNVTAGGKDKTSPVTGYAVFADGKRVTDVDSPSSKIHIGIVQNLKGFF